MVEPKGGISVKQIYLQVEFLPEYKSLWQTLVGTFFLKGKSHYFWHILNDTLECQANLPNCSQKASLSKTHSIPSQLKINKKKLGLTITEC